MTRLELRNEARNSAGADFRASFRSSSRVTPSGVCKSSFFTFYSEMRVWPTGEASVDSVRSGSVVGKIEVSLVSETKFDSWSRQYGIDGTVAGKEFLT